MLTIIFIILAVMVVCMISTVIGLIGWMFTSAFGDLLIFIILVAIVVKLFIRKRK